MTMKESKPREMSETGANTSPEPEEVAEAQDTDDLVEFLSRKIEEQR